MSAREARVWRAILAVFMVACGLDASWWAANDNFGGWLLGVVSGGIAGYYGGSLTVYTRDASGPVEGQP